VAALISRFALRRGALVCLLALANCVQTDLDPQALVFSCATRANASVVADSVVWMSVSIGDNLIRHCSGVAISDRLVVTAFSCLAIPGDLAGPYDAGPEPAFPRAPDNYLDPDAYDELCGSAGTWAPVEDGTFRTRLLGVVSINAVAVGLQGQSDAILAVDAILSTGAASRCSDGIAVLLLRNSLHVRPVPIRLDDPGSKREPVLSSGSAPVPGKFVAHIFDSLVDELSLEEATETLPAHSLSISPGACQFDRGGAVISKETGALIAIIASGIGTNCDNTSGRSIGTRLAPFRRFLLESATVYSQQVYSELRNAASRQDACTAPGEADAPAPD
jgi:hypothetical protein